METESFGEKMKKSKIKFAKKELELAQKVLIMAFVLRLALPLGLVLFYELAAGMVLTLAGVFIFILGLTFAIVDSLEVGRRKNDRY